MNGTKAIAEAMSDAWVPNRVAILPHRREPTTMAPKNTMTSRALIDACRPFERLKDFPEVASAPQDLIDRVAQKFAHVINKI